MLFHVRDHCCFVVVSALLFIFFACSTASATVSITASSPNTPQCVVDTYTVTVSNPGGETDDLTEMVIAVDLQSANLIFQTDSATITTPNNGNLNGAAARPQIAGTVLTWTLDDASLFNDNVELNPGQSLTIVFDVGYNCSAATTIPTVTHDAERPRGAAIGQESDTVNINISPGALTVTITPTLQTINLDQIPDDTLAQWSIEVKNTGLGDIHNVIVADTFDTGLDYVPSSAQINGNILSPADGNGTYIEWNMDQFGANPDGAGGLEDLDGDGEFDDLAANESLVITTVQAQVISCSNLNNTADARYLCYDESTVCYDTDVAGKSASASIAVNVVDPEISITFDAAGKLDNISFCDGVNDANIVISNAAGAGQARSFTYELRNFPTGFDVTNVSSIPAGTTWNSGTATFENIPDIDGGNNVTIEFDVDWTGPGDPCNTANSSAKLKLLPSYTNVCGEPFDPPVGVDSISLGPQDHLSLNLSASVVTTPDPPHDRVDVGDTGIIIAVNATIGTDFTRYGSFNETRNITCDLPTDWEYQNVGNATVSGSKAAGYTFTWTHTFTPGDPSFGQNIIIDATDEPCDAGTVDNITASFPTIAVTDCQSCAYNIGPAGSSATLFVNQGAASGNPLDGSWKSVSYNATQTGNQGEACRNIEYSITYDFSVNATSNWNGIVLTEELPLNQALVTLDSVNYDGVEFAGGVITVGDDVTINAGDFDLYLEDLNGNATNPDDGHQLNVIFTTSTTAASAGSDYQFSNLVIPGRASGCGGDDDYEEGVPVNIGAQSMSVGISGPTLLEHCGVETFTISVSKSEDFYAYDPIVTLELDPDGDGDINYGYIPNSTTFPSGFTDTLDAGVAAFEPASVGTTLVWDFSAQGSGDYKTVGSIRLQLRLACDEDQATDLDDALSVSLDYNQYCNNDNAQNQSSSGSYNLSSQYIESPTMAVFMSPAKLYISENTEDWLLTATNTGSGTAYNVVLTDTLDTDLAYSTADINATRLNGQDVIWEFQVGADPDAGGKGLEDLDGDGFYDDLAPGQSVDVTLTVQVTGCTNLDNSVQAATSCDVRGADPFTDHWSGAGCETSGTASAQAFLRSTQGISSITFDGTIPLCGTETAHYTMKNSGQGNLYNVDAGLILPAGVSFVNGTATYDVDADGNNVWETTGSVLVDTPEGDGSAATPYIWDEGEIPALGDLDPNAKVRINFDLKALCGATGSTLNVQSKGAWTTACGAGETETPGDNALTFQDMSASVKKEARNVTKGSGWEENELGVDAAPGDVVEYRLTVSVPGGGITAQNITLTDLLPDTVVDATSTANFSTAQDSGDGTAGTPLTWDPATVCGGDLQMAAGESFVVTYQVTADACANELTEAEITYGCNEDGCAARNDTDPMKLVGNPDVSSSGSITITTNTWTTCSGNATIEVTNIGSTATNTGITATLPAGYTYDSNGTATITATGGGHTFDPVPSWAGNVLTWSNSKVDFIGPGETVTIGFWAMSDGTNCDSTPSNDANDPDINIPNGNLQVVFNYEDPCNTPGSQNKSVVVNPTQPDIDIAITPLEQIAEPGDTATWEITLTNDGDADASDIVLKYELADGFENAAVDTGQAVDSWVVAGNSTGTWTIPGPIAASGGTWTVNGTMDVKNPPGGALNTLAWVTGACKDQANNDNCNYSYDEYESFTAAFTINNDVDKATAAVGELLTYTVTATFDNTEWFRGHSDGTPADVTFINTLPPQVEYISSSATGNNTVGLSAANPTETGSLAAGEVQTWTAAADFQGQQTFEYQIQARIRNDSANTGTTNLTDTFDVEFGIDFDNDGTADADFDGPSGARDTALTDVKEPVLVVTNTLTPNEVDSGDSVTITMQVENVGNSTANHVSVSNILNDTNLSGAYQAGVDSILFDASSVAPDTTPAGWTYGVNNAGAADAEVVYTPNAGTGSLAPGANTTFVFTVDVNSSVVGGSNYENQSTALAHSLTDSDGEYNNGTYDRQPTASGSDDVNISTMTPPQKKLMTTSESSTTPNASNDAAIDNNPPVAVGEVVRMQFRYTFPEGVTQSIRLSDILLNPTSNQPWGRYVPNSAWLERNNTGLTCTLNPGGINAAAANTPISVDGSIQESNSTHAQEYYLDLGNVNNVTVNNGQEEILKLTLDVLVLNSAVVNHGDILTDYGLIRYQPSGGSDQYSSTGFKHIHVAEPRPEVTVTPGAGTAPTGGIVTYAVKITNAADPITGAPAFNLTVTNELPDVFSSPGTVTGVDTTGAPSGPAVSASIDGSNTLNGTISRLDPGEYVIINYQAVLTSQARPGMTIKNIAKVKATSLPGPTGSTLASYGGGAASSAYGGAGALTGKRIGSTGVNDLKAQGSAGITITKPQITKEIRNQKPWYAIGDTVDFRVRASFSADTYNNVTVVDTLPSGLSYQATSTTVTLPGSSNSTTAPHGDGNPAFFSYVGDTLTFDFGSLGIQPSAGDVIIDYQVVVDNEIDNQYPDILNNSAELNYEDPANPGPVVNIGPVSTAVSVGEPNLELQTKYNRGAGIAAGDVVGVELKLANTGVSTAYQVDLVDLLPNGVLNNITNETLRTSGGNVYLNGTTTPLATAHISINTVNNPSDRLIVNPFQIDPGASVIIAFDATVMVGVGPGDTIRNAPTVDYTSLSGGGRDNSTNPGNVDDDDDSDLNNYEESAAATIIAGAGVGIHKFLQEPKLFYTLGELVDYVVRVYLDHGTTTSLIVHDVLPPDMTYVGHSIAAGNVNLLFNNAGYNTPNIVGQDVEFDFGNVNNPDNGDNTDDFIDITITTRVDNVAATQDGTDLINGESADGSTVYIDWGGGVDVYFDTDTDATSAPYSGIPITVIEPDLNITKSIDRTQQAQNGTVEYTVTVAHSASSRTDAYDVVVTDTLPGNLDYISGSHSLDAGDVTEAPPNLTFNLNKLTLSEGSRSFTYQARIDPAAPLGGALNNSAAVVWAGLSGATGAADSGRNYNAGSNPPNDYRDAAAVGTTPTALNTIEADKTVAIQVGGGDSTADPGDRLRYTVILTNTAAVPDSDVIFTDTIPAETTYVPGTLTTTVGTVDASGAPDLVVNVGNMGVDDTVTITFDVTINAGTPGGTVISNQGTVDGNNSDPEDTDDDGNDGDGDEPTTIQCSPQPDLYGYKSVSLTTDSVLPNGSINVGDRVTYEFILSNTGNIPLANATLTDTIDANLTINNVTNGSNAGQVVTSNSFNMPVGGNQTITVECTVDAAGTYTNQGDVLSNDTTPTQTDGNTDHDDGLQPTIFEAQIGGVAGTHALNATKRDTLSVDGSTPNEANPLDRIRYTISLYNSGSATASPVGIVDPIPNGTTYVVGSLVTSTGTVNGTNPIEIAVPQINPGDWVFVNFEVDIPQDTKNDFVVSNQARIFVNGILDKVSSDPDITGSTNSTTDTPVVAAVRTPYYVPAFSLWGLFACIGGVLALLRWGGRKREV